MARRKVEIPMPNATDTKEKKMVVEFDDAGKFSKATVDGKPDKVSVGSPRSITDAAPLDLAGKKIVYLEPGSVVACAGSYCILVTDTLGSRWVCYPPYPPC